MKLLLISTILLISTSNLLYAQSGMISGIVKNNQTGSVLPGANILLTELAIGTSTNKNGQFSIEVNPGIYLIRFSYVGFKSELAEVEISGKIKTELIISLEPSSVALGDVTVSSTRFVKMEKDVPLPMEVVDKSLIEKTTAFTISDLLKNEPGLSLSRDGIWATSIVIRGLSKSNIVSMIDGNRIETATDLSAGLSMIDLSDIERVEVIKGGVSSLYGTGALGGVVNILTKRKIYGNSFFLSGSVSGDYNSVNEGSAGRLSLVTGNENLYLKLSASKRNALDINTPRGILKNSRYSDKNISVSAGIKPFVNHELILDYQKFDAEDVGIPGGSVFPSAADVRYPTQKRDMASIEYNISALASFLPKLSLKYYNQNIYRDVENIPNAVTNVAGQPPRRNSVLSILPYGRHFTNGVQLQSDWVIAKNHLLITGIDVWQRNLDSRRERNLKLETLDSTGTTVVSTTFRTIGEKPLPEAKYRSTGLFSQYEHSIFNDLKFTLGGRIDQINIKNTEVYNPVYIITNGVLNNNPADSLIYGAGNQNNFSWGGNIGLLYSLVKNIDLSFTAAHSFRSPSPEERFQFIDQGSIVRFGNPELKPETGYFFDFGLRVWEDNFSFKGSLFLNLMKELVADIPGTYESRNATYKTNIGKARIYGFDFSSEYNINNYLVTHLSGAYVRGEDTGNETDLPQIPPFNSRIGVRSDYLHYVYVDITASVFSKQTNTAQGEFETPGYVYYDFHISSLPVDFKYTTLQFFAGVDNIFDKAYRNHLATNRGLINIEPGRNIFVKAKLNW